MGEKNTLKNDFFKTFFIKSKKFQFSHILCSLDRWTDQNHFPLTATLIVWKWCGTMRWNRSLHLVHLLCFSNHQWDRLEIYLLLYYCWCAGNESSLKAPLWELFWEWNTIALKCRIMKLLIIITSCSNHRFFYTKAPSSLDRTEYDISCN